MNVRQRLAGMSVRDFTPHLFAILIFTGYSIALTWPLARRMRDTVASWGDPVFQVWTLGWNWHALTTDPLSIFDANVFYPWRNVLTYSDHLFGQTLFVLPVLALTDNPLLADNVAFFLGFILSALAMYLLVFDLTRNPFAGILAGVAFSFAPTRLAHYEHLNIIWIVWLPVGLLCLRRITLSRGLTRLWWTAALGATFFIQGLSGVYFMYFMVILLVMASGVYLAFAALDRDWEVAKGIGMAAVACAVAGVLLLPTLLPYLRLRDDLGLERPAAEVAFWSANWTDYLAAWPGNDLWGTLFADNHRDIEQDLFPGLFILVFAAIGLFNRRYGRVRWVLLAVALGSFVLSFGISVHLFSREFPLPYRILYEWLPGFRAIRVAARFSHLALVGLGGLSGLGLDLLWRNARTVFRPRYWGLASLGILVAGLSLLWIETEVTWDLPPPLPVDNPRADYAYLAEHPGPVLELPMGDGPVASAWPNFWSTKHWQPVVNGYSANLPPTYDLLRERMREPITAETVDLLQGIGVRHIVVHADAGSEERTRLERSLEAHSEIELVLPGPDAVYELSADPWMWRLVEALPAGGTVALPDVTSDPLAYGFFVAILQRQGHGVAGDGMIGYLELDEPDRSTCYAIFEAERAPSSSGYERAEPIAVEAGYALYRRASCG